MTTYVSNLVNFPVVAGGAALLFTAGIAAPAILPALGLLGIGKILDIVMIKVYIGLGFLSHSKIINVMRFFLLS